MAVEEEAAGLPPKSRLSGLVMAVGREGRKNLFPLFSRHWSKKRGLSRVLLPNQVYQIVCYNLCSRREYDAPGCPSPKSQTHIHNTDHNVSQGKRHHDGIPSTFFKYLKLSNSGQDLTTYSLTHYSKYANMLPHHSRIPLNFIFSQAAFPTFLFYACVAR